MWRKKWFILAGLAVVLATTFILSGLDRVVALHERQGRDFEVTITNITRGQILSPAVVAIHSSRMEPLFVLGSPASEELATIAEDAVNDPLVEALSQSRQVRDVVTIFGENGPILPGESASVEVEIRGRFRNVTAVGMLVTTNDAFYALNGERAPSSGSSSFLLLAYDAGSEGNNELCSHIPGPPCGNAGVRDTENAEGYVHVHAGVHGTGDLIPAEHDWRNPVAQITIRQIRREDDDDDD